ncbi:hypothetical protein [Caulobacter sp. RHG1]|uniref:hypothetical protein n=1 Tax=Caulobacter sp. (strain RHG1) TaxID=2545762 RepID=UPI0015545632|nr:hypothetical protein [Caulobacter sp. RHG1]
MFEPFNAKACSLCGSTAEPTGEHKLKASQIRAEFDGHKMFIREQGGVARPVRGPKSQELCFDRPMCGPCNNATTQPADKEFDRLVAAARALIADGQEPGLALIDPRYAPGSEPYLNLFRFFAKMLCAHLAEVEAPRPVHMSAFALGLNATNCVWLQVDHDWEYARASEAFGDHPYAAHGGLVVYGHIASGEPRAFHSTVSIGALRFVFWSRLTLFERLALRWRHPKFFAWCRAQVIAASAKPIEHDLMLKLGLGRDAGQVDQEG